MHEHEHLPELSVDMKLVMNLEILLSRGVRYNQDGYARVDLVEDRHANTFEPYTRVERFITGESFDTPQYDVSTIIPPNNKNGRVKNKSVILRAMDHQLKKPTHTNEYEDYLPLSVVEVEGLIEWLDPSKLCVRKPNRKKQAEAFVSRVGLPLALGAFSVLGFGFKIGNINRKG